MKKLVILCVCLAIVGLFCLDAIAAPAQKQQPPQAQAKPQQFKPKEAKIDRNYDGVVDRIEVYDEKGLILRVEADTNGDGKMDEWVYYEAGIPVKGEKDLNADGKADTAMFYDVKGVIIRTEADTNGDGKIDEWVFYTNGVPSKAEKDTNRDGKADTWVNY